MTTHKERRCPRHGSILSLQMGPEVGIYMCPDGHFVHVTAGEPEKTYTATCTGCYREFENYAGGATYCLRCTRAELERATERGYRDEVRGLVEIACDLVMKAANQAALFDSEKEQKLDRIHGMLSDA